MKMGGAIWRQKRFGMARNERNNVKRLYIYIYVIDLTETYYRTVTLNSGGYKYVTVFYKGGGLSLKCKCILMIYILKYIKYIK